MVILSFAVDAVSWTPNNAVALVILICIPILAFISLSTTSHTGLIFEHEKKKKKKCSVLSVSSEEYALNLFESAISILFCKMLVGCILCKIFHCKTLSLVSLVELDALSQCL